MNMKSHYTLFHALCLTLVILLMPLFAFGQENVFKGDANGDGVINAADIVEVTAYIMGSQSAQFNLMNADANGDGTIDNADIKAIANLIMKAYIDKEDVKIVFYYLDESSSFDVPFFASIMENNAMIGFKNGTSNPVLLSYNFYADLWFIIRADENKLLYYPYDPTTGTVGDRIIVFNELEDHCRVGFFQADWDKNEFVADTLVIENSENACRRMANKRAINRVSVEQYTTGEFFEKLSNKFNIQKKVTELVEKKMPQWKWLKNVVKGLEYEAVTTNSLSKQLKNKEPENVRFEDIGKDIIVENVKGEAKDMLGIKKSLWSNPKDCWNLLKSGTSELLFNAGDNYYSDQEVSEMTNRLWSHTQISIPEETINLRNLAKYHVSVSVSDVTSNSVVLNGAYKEVYQGAAVNKMGYRLIGPDGEEDIDAFNLPRKEVRGLKPGTTYQVYAYLSSVHASGGKYTSKTITFTTLEDNITVSPESLSFDAEGGTKTVTVTATEGVKWSVTSYPGWTKVSTSDNVLTVTVGEGDEEERSGSIVIEAQMLSGEVKNVTINISQEAKKIEIPTTGDIVFTGTGCNAILNIKDGEYYLKIYVDDYVMDEGCLSKKPTTTYVSFDDGVSYSIQNFQYSASENEIRRSYDIFAGPDRIAIDMVISNLNTQTPTLDYRLTVTGHDYGNIVLHMTGKR